MNNQSPIYCENGLQYTLNENGAFIYRYEGDDEKLVIPDTLGGKPVIGLLARSLANTKATPNPYIREIDYTTINRLKLKEIVLPETLQIIEEEAFGGLGALEKLVIPDTVISIHGYAFRGCHALKHIRLPKQIRGIGAYTFYNCLQLEEVIIPDGITYVGSRAFENCRSLKHIHLPDSGKKSPNGWEKNVFINCESLESFDVDPDNRLLSSQDGVLYSNDKTVLILYPQGRKEEVFSIPEGVTVLTSSAFYNNPYLKEVYLPNSLREIKDNVFAKCVNLKKAVPPSSLTSIETGAYSFCANLEEFPMPSSLSHIGEKAFIGCDRFEHLIFPDSLNVRLLYICSMENLKTVRIPLGVQYIGALSGCPKLEKVDIAEGHPRYVMEDGMLLEMEPGKKRILLRLLQSDKREVFRIPDNIRRIQRGAFNGCGFREVFFPDKMKLVPDAFENCTNLETIHFPASLRAIDTLAFSGCTAMKKLVLPDGLEEVGNYTFAGCTGLESVELPASLRNFGVSLFQGCTGLTDVYLRGGARTWCRRNVIRNRRTNFPDQAVFRYK